MKTFIVVGNGIIGSFAAVMAKKNFPDSRVVLVGPKSREHSASMAAGAMANVYAEYEALPNSQMVFQEKGLQLGLRGREGWKDFLRASNNERIVTCENTLVYLKKGSSPFEQRNFAVMTDRALQDKAGTLEAIAHFHHKLIDRNKVEAVLTLHGEFAVDTTELFKVLDEFIRGLGVETLHKKATRVDAENGDIHLEDQTVLHGDQVLVAAGAMSGTLLQDSGVVDMFQGAGLALLVAADSRGPNAEPLTEVIRSVNRGGAQCGVHLVPRVDGSLYVGAGNAVLPPGPPPLRFETVRYLLNAVEEEFFGRNSGYQFHGDVLLGSRPKTIDGHPLIGPLTLSKVFVISGTNRVGLTWAPALVADWIRWVQKGELAEYMEGWKPQRNLVGFAPPEESVNYFAESRAGAAFEHGLIAQSSDAWAQRKDELLQVGFDIRGALPKLFQGITPDSWTAVESLHGKS